MTPDDIRELVDAEYPDLVPQLRQNPNGWSFYHRKVVKGANSTRIFRVVQQHRAAPVMFKRAVTARLASGEPSEVRITGGAAQVRQLIDRELSLYLHENGANGRDESGSRTRQRQHRKQQSPVKGEVPPGFAFEFVQGDVDSAKPLIYLWEIRDNDGNQIYCYVGKAKNGSRPTKRYSRNVRNLLDGRPYGFREVHYELARATVEGHRVVLSFLRNVNDQEDIDEVERQYQRQLGCKGGRIKRQYRYG